jgi:hypothetical protein
MRSIRIGCGQGFWGDDIEAPLALVQQDNLDYLVMDFLAEITMSILQKQRAKDPSRGYATDVVGIIGKILPTLVDKGTKVVTNAGGVNPIGCGRAILRVVEELGFAGRIKVGVVSGDDLMPSIEAITATEDLDNMDTGHPFADIADRLLSANAYLGAAPIREALDGGADIVICGRSTDTALVLGPLQHEFGWADDDWDRMAAGIVAGHLVECSAQVSGGNHQADWKSVPGLDQVGYPVVVVDEEGKIVLTKPPGTGGRVSVATATEQLLYEIGDPRAVLTPDVTVDWTSFTLAQTGPDEVQVTGVKGSPPPPTLKVSAAYADGYSTVLYWPYAWPDTAAKARAAISKIEHKVAALGLDLDSRADVFGLNAIHGRRLPAPAEDPGEVLVRFAARSANREAIERLSIEIAPMLFGPPGQAGFIAGGRGRVSQIVSYWPALLDPKYVDVHVDILDAAALSA